MTFTEILTEARRLSKTNSTSYSTADITVSSNRALDRTVALIREAEGRWQWDDSNYDDLPSATRSIQEGQSDYELDPSHLRIERFEIKDTNGGWTKLFPFDQADIHSQALTDFLGTPGIPRYYDKAGNSIFLYPAPNYDQAASLKVFYERGPDYFETTDTTKTPGFNPLFHRLIPLWGAYDYALINQLSVAPDLRVEIGLMEEQLKEFYARRDKDEHIRLQARYYNFR